MSNEKIKVLLSAYACEPNSGSEPNVGWNWALEISKFAEAWVVTRGNNKSRIEEYINNNRDLPKIHFVYVDYPQYLLKYKKFFPLWVYYFLWQLLAYFIVKKIDKQVNFDLYHHITFMTSRINFTSFIGKCKVIGPIGGLHLFPLRYWRYVGCSVKELLRNISIIRLKYSFIWKKFISNYDKIIFTHPDFINYVKDSTKKKCVFLQIGVNLPIDSKFYYEIKKVPIIYWGGKLEKWKGLILLLDALNSVNNPFELHISGTGKHQNYFIEKSKQYVYSDRIKFHGWLSNNEQQAIFKKSDIFVFTSLRETTGLILLEAMSYGKAIISLDYGGPSTILDKSSAIKIPLKNPNETISLLRESIISLLSDEKLRRDLSVKAYNRFKEKFTWDKKREEIHALYKEIISKQ